MSSAGEDRCMAPAWVPLIKERGFVLEGKGSETWPGWYPQACLASFRQRLFHTSTGIHPEPSNRTELVAHSVCTSRWDMMVLVAGAFSQTPCRVLRNWLWTRNLFWPVPVPELLAQHGSRKSHFTERAEERMEGPAEREREERGWQGGSCVDDRHCVTMVSWP